MKKNALKLVCLLAALTMSMAMVACGAEKTPDSSVGSQSASSEAATSTESGASSEAQTSGSPMALNYEADPEAFVGNWVLTSAYTAADGMLQVAPQACYLEIETSIDTNKLVDEGAYIHADAINLKGTMSFNHADIDVEDYKCSGNWSDWTVVDVVGEGNANFKGAVKFKVRDNDEGVFFDILTGTEVEDMELFDVLGLNAQGQLILGYSENHIENKADAEWEYAYIFEKAA